MQIGKGMVSRVYLHNGTISKQYLTPFSKYSERSIIEHWVKEVEALTKLSGRKHFPELINIDEANRIIIMSYCGEPLTRENLPEDWKKQCKQIERVFRHCRVFHQDFVGEYSNPIPPHNKNIQVKDGIIYIVDFGIWPDGKSKHKDSITSIIRKVYEGRKRK